MDLELARLDLRHIEQHVDHVEQVMPAATYVARIFGVSWRQGAANLFGHHVGEAHYGIERGPQFVTDGGQETRLGFRGLFGLLARRIDLPFGILAHADIAKHGQHVTQ